MIHIRNRLASVLSGGSFRLLAERLLAGTVPVEIAGAVGGARALTVASAILCENRPVAILTPGNEEARHLAREMQSFLELLSPEPRTVTHLPSLEVDPYRGLSPHPEIASARAQALWRILRDERVVLVASARAAAVRLHGPQRFLAGCLDLELHEDHPPELIREHLLVSGFVEDDPVTDPGEFSLRGGILDIFTPQLEHPVRVEFFGDQIDSIRLFDVESQRSVEPIPRVEIVPMREFRCTRDLLARWADEVLIQWSAPFHPHLNEERALARQGEAFPGMEFHIPAIDPPDHSLFDYLRGFRLIVMDRDVLESTLEKHHAELYERYLDRVEAQKPVAAPEQIYLSVEEARNGMDRLPGIRIDELGIEGGGRAPLYLSSQPTRKYHGDIRQLTSDIQKSRDAGEQLILMFPNLGRAERMIDILQESGIPAHLCRDRDGAEESQPVPDGVVLVGAGFLHSGCYLPASGMRLISGLDVFDEVEVGPAPGSRKKSRRSAFVSDFRDLKPGDFVVHVEHGIGMFHGMKTLSIEDGAREFVLLTYADDARLYVPVERLDLIQKYSNMGGTRPSLDRLGGTSWTRTKSRIRKSMRDMAAGLLKLYAERQMVEGVAFSPDTAWQGEFEDAFEFDLTPDQSDAIDAVKHDLEAPRPMDRLLCGDVGYGKTEVAMRAAFKVVMDGRQVALLAPTTVLAFQHFNTFRQRFTAFPVRIQLLSRFRTAAEQKRILEDLELGRIDILIGTHRLLSKDVAFKDLGLVIVDEEQRFGVAHKERLKALKTRIDVLTLSATPIPRTLHMALLGLRDLSTIETPPKNRLAIQTSVVRYSPEVIRSAIELELARNGQVYCVHNRVETIDSFAAMIQRLVPGARIGIAHGQMSERELERVMLRFVRDETDILVATTIIENGLDIPRVNTILINRADLYGLSQLYQLRGRVGRSDRRAYAYLLVPADDVLSEVARKRLAAIREFSDLGTGFRVAALDLEIRGAGNLLGGEQHGHINAVGFDYYCRLLEQTIQELQGQEPEAEFATTINLHLDIRIPDDYIPDAGQRLRMYKRISSAESAEELDLLRQEMVDRFGQHPEAVENLFRYARLRQEILALRIPTVEKHQDRIHFKLTDESKISAEKLLELISRNRSLSLSPQGVLSMQVEDSGEPGLFASIHGILGRVRA